MSRYGRTHQPDNALVSRWGAVSLIKSIQRGTIVIAGAANNTATITAVDLNNTVLIHLGQTDNNGTRGDLAWALIALSNATTVFAGRVLNNVAATTVGYVVVEFMPGVLKSVQRGTITNSAATNDATITEVNPDKSFLIKNGIGDNSATIVSTHDTYLSLVNGTTVRSTCNTANNQDTAFQVVEWF